MSVYFVYALSLLHGVGIFSSQMVLPLYALNLGASPVAVGFLAATFSLFPTLLAVAAGRLTDRFGSHLTIERTDDNWAYEILKEDGQ